MLLIGQLPASQQQAAVKTSRYYTLLLLSLTSAMRAERLGSYSSRCTTAAAVPSGRAKSMWRYTLRWPPPRWRTVITPCALRPPLRDRPSVSGLNGPPFHRPLRDVTMRPRKPAGWGHVQAYPHHLLAK